MSASTLIAKASAAAVARPLGPLDTTQALIGESSATAAIEHVRSSGGAPPDFLLVLLNAVSQSDESMLLGFVGAISDALKESAP